VLLQPVLPAAAMLLGGQVTRTIAGGIAKTATFAKYPSLFAFGEYWLHVGTCQVLCMCDMSWALYAALLRSGALTSQRAMYACQPLSSLALHVIPAIANFATLEWHSRLC
jgi:hypothetical protein